MFGIPPDQVSSEQRVIAKTLDFGIFYGRGWRSIRDAYGVDEATAKKWFTLFREAFPVLIAWTEAQPAQARMVGYVCTAYGRRRHLAHALNSDYEDEQAEAERQCVNAQVQGTAAECAFIALRRIYDRFVREGLDAKIVGTVHDSIQVECAEEIATYVARVMKEEMERPYPKIDVPIEADPVITQCWYENKRKTSRPEVPSDEELGEEEEEEDEVVEVG